MGGNAKDVAQRLLEEYGEHPPVNVRRLAEKLGIEVQDEDLEPHVSGLIVRQPERTVIAVNERHHPNRQRFTIAHELGHYMLHSGGSVFIDSSPVFFRREDVSSRGVNPEEIQANQFAAELLMPEQEIRELVREPIDAFDDIALRRLAAYFDVSIQAVTIRLVNLRLITSWEVT